MMPGCAADAQSLYAFVKFYSSLAAARALHMTSGRLYLHGQHLKVTAAVVHNTEFIIY